jgi:hypothetical protein
MRTVRLTIMILLIATMPLSAMDNATDGAKEIIKRVQPNYTAFTFVKSLVWNPPMITIAVVVAGLVYISHKIARNAPENE